MLYRFGLYLTGEVELAREMAQDTIRVALSKDWPAGMDADGELGGGGEQEAGSGAGKWLRGILHNLLRNQRRKERRSRLLFDSEMVVAAERRFVETRADRDEVWQARRFALEGCLERMPVDERELLRDRYELGRAVKDLADLRRLEANALSKRLERVRRALRDCVERRLKEDIHE
jgi:RNA polymerase sigma-70 factor (ECF subfamily)